MLAGPILGPWVGKQNIPFLPCGDIPVLLLCPPGRPAPRRRVSQPIAGPWRAKHPTSRLNIGRQLTLHALLQRLVTHFWGTLGSIYFLRHNAKGNTGSVVDDECF